MSKTLAGSLVVERAGWWTRPLPAVRMHRFDAPIGSTCIHSPASATPPPRAFAGGKATRYFGLLTKVEMGAEDSSADPREHQPLAVPLVEGRTGFSL